MFILTCSLTHFSPWLCLLFGTAPDSLWMTQYHLSVQNFHNPMWQRQSRKLFMDASCHRKTLQRFRVRHGLSCVIGPVWPGRGHLLLSGSVAHASLKTAVLYWKDFLVGNYNYLVGMNCRNISDQKSPRLERGYAICRASGQLYNTYWK